MSLVKVPPSVRHTVYGCHLFVPSWTVYTVCCVGERYLQVVGEEWVHEM